MLGIQTAQASAIASIEDARTLASQVKGTSDMKRVAASLGKSIPEINDFALRTIGMKQQLGSWYESLPSASGKRNDLTLSERSDDVRTATKTGPNLVPLPIRTGKATKILHLVRAL